MGMYIQVFEENTTQSKKNWRSPVVYIHSDSEEVLYFIKKWRYELNKYTNNGKNSGMPMDHLDVNTCFCDLLYQLGKYYLDNTDKRLTDGRIKSWIRCFNETEINNSTGHIIEIFLKN